MRIPRRISMDVVFALPLGLSAARKVRPSLTADEIHAPVGDDVRPSDDRDSSDRQDVFRAGARSWSRMTAVDGRPDLYGFFYEEAFTSPRQAADIRGRMAEFAARWNYRLAKVFTEKPGQAPMAFNALREAVRRDGAAVAVPNVDHLKPYGDVLELVAELQEASSHHVMRTEAG